MFESNIVPTVLTTIRYRHYIYWNDQWYRKQFFFYKITCFWHVIRIIVNIIYVLIKYLTSVNILFNLIHVWWFLKNKKSNKIYISSQISNRSAQNSTKSNFTWKHFIKKVLITQSTMKTIFLFLYIHLERTFLLYNFVRTTITLYLTPRI